MQTNDPMQSRGQTKDERITELEAQLAAVTAERDALKRDSERFRWLVDTLESAKGGAHLWVNDELSVYEVPEPGKEVRLQWYPDTPIGFYAFEAATIREAIDAALAAVEEK